MQIMAKKAQSFPPLILSFVILMDWTWIYVHCKPSLGSRLFEIFSALATIGIVWLSKQNSTFWKLCPI